MKPKRVHGTSERSGSEKQSGPSLSVCLITRDEADRVRVALDSVREVAAEVVVVDTGSTDDTVEIAASSGARVIESPWNNDFSHSRNAGLDVALGDWILCLDADERLAPNQGRRLRRLMTAPADAYFVRIRSPQAGRLGEQTFVHAFPRLFRNRPDFRFQRRVHEQIHPSLEAAGARIRHSDLDIEHDGYAVDHAARRLKLERNLMLLQMDLEERPGDGFVLYHLGETYALLEDPATARTFYRRALEIEELPPEYRASALQNLASALLSLNDLDPAIEAARDALRWNRNALTSYLILGSAECRKGECRKAIGMVDRYLKACDDPARRTNPSLMGFEPDRARAYLIRGESSLRSGRLRDAEADADRLLKIAPEHAAGRRLMARIALTRGSSDAARTHLQRAVDLDPDHAASWRDLALLQAKEGDVDGALTTMNAAIHRQKQAILYDCQGLLRIKAGDFPGAADSYRRLLKLEPTCAEAHRRLAGLYQKMGDSDRARAHLANVGRTEGRNGVPMSASSRHFPEQGAAGD